MKAMAWLLVVALAAVAAYWLWHARRRWAERARGAEHRMASFLAEAMKSAKPALATVPASPDSVAQQKLLFEAAAKAGEAGEPALAIQLYARLLARYPDSALSEQARSNVQAQKQKLVKV
jgi:hypothetical protein